MNNNLNIFNIQNYKENIDTQNLFSFMKVYTELLKEYLEFLLNNIDVTDINNHFIFITKRGLDTFKHIFNILCLYTKNFNLILHHIKKSYLYYVEFIGQIGHDNHAYLKLNSRDASLFVYKKTIYEINNEFKKTFTLTEEEKAFHFKITKMIEIMNTIIIIIIKNVKIKKHKLTFNCIKGEIEKIEKNYYKGIHNFDKLNIKILSEFLNKIELENIETKKILELVNNIINKILNKHFTETKVIDKLHGYKNNEKIRKLSTIKYMNWLFK
jgi:hypothetical protein